MSDNSRSRLWVVPVNDLEAWEIVYLLDQHKERVLLSRQRWGASWTGVEEEIREYISSSHSGLKAATMVIGVELQGVSPWGGRTLDHHRYESEDRTNPKSSLEQAAELLGAELNRWQTIVAVNDRAYIPGLLREIQDIQDWELRMVRLQDRRAQGVTWDMEQRARLVIQSAKRRGDSWWVDIEASSHSGYSDVLLLEHAAKEWMLAAADTWVYSGPRVSDFWNLSLPEKKWSGGAPDFGYFGVYRPGPDSRAAISAIFWH